MLPTILLAAVTASAAFPAPGTYRYAASLGGQRVGEWSVTVKSDTGDTEVDENSSASIGGMALSATAALVLGSDLAPSKYSGNYRMAGQNPTVSATLTSTTATVIGAMTNQPQQIVLRGATRHFVVIEPGLLAGLFALPAQLGAWNDQAVTWIAPATGQAQSLTANRNAGLARPANVASQDAAISIDQPLAVTIWYDPATLVPDVIIVPSQNATLTRERS
jgi:hypothetical protein